MAFRANRPHARPNRREPSPGNAVSEFASCERKFAVRAGVVTGIATLMRSCKLPCHELPMPDPIPGTAELSADSEGEFASRPDSLEGKTLVFVDLGKPNGPELYECFADIFAGEFGVAEFRYHEKPHFSSPLPDDEIDEILAADVDAVVEGISDCGSCNSSSAVDAIAFERRGIPTVQVITDNFLELNRNISGSYGYDELPLVAVPHPTRYLDGKEIAGLADRIKWSVQTTLTCEDCLSGACSIDAKETAESGD